MRTKLLNRIWTHLVITFYGDAYTGEGFERTQNKFTLPDNMTELDPQTKRRMTICNLFANQNLSIREIARVLDSSLHQVVPALIESGLIKERRRRKRGAESAKAARSALSILPEEAKTSGEPEPQEKSNAGKASSAEAPPQRAASSSLVNLAQQGSRRIA
ncbi:MAG: hypothetical protein L0312_20490 [Acidobacteria bacterium]|nr:hypothetical protein [Acidobacteriota bacterium]